MGEEKKIIYLDNAATTRTAKEVVDAMLPYFTELYGNPSSVYSFSQKSKEAITTARETIAKALGAKTEEIYFTAGGSEADNWALKAAAEAYRAKGNHIITTKIEHHAILHTGEWLEKQGFEVFTAAEAAKEESPDAGQEDSGRTEGPGEEAEQAVVDIEPKEQITYDDFAKLQFQVGEILSCEAVPKSKKLLCSQVKIGSQVKQIVSGIKAFYSPEEMVGKKVMVLVNLKPAKLAGVLSEGMLLCAEDADGNLALMTPEKAMPSGAEIM